jgi:phosphoglycerate dehydrogenase-like enzyme
LRITVHPAKNINEVPDELWKRCEVLYTDRIIPDEELAPNLKWVQFHYAGIDSTVGINFSERPGFTITTLSGAAVSQMAEYILTMLLAFGRKLPALSRQQKKAEWPEDRWKRFEPRELRDSTVGIVGYGSIGRQVARLLREFGATVLATKNDAMHPGDSGYTPEGMGDPNGDLVHRLYPAQALKSMLKDCDFVVVCVPLSGKTRNLIDAEALAACKPSAYLIDVSRGEIVDHDALIKALNEQKLAGAALDVFPEEPLDSDSPLWEMPNVIITPHIAGVSAKYDERAITLFAENLSRYIADLPLYNIFNPKRGY